MVFCTVAFSNSNPNGVFYSGQEVSGSVTLQNEKPRMIRALLLKVEGFAHTHWTETSGTGDNRRSSSYSAHEDYMSTTTVLLNYGQGEGELPVGNHTFSFALLFLQRSHQAL